MTNIASVPSLVVNSLSYKSNVSFFKDARGREIDKEKNLFMLHNCENVAHMCDVV